MKNGIEELKLQEMALMSKQQKGLWEGYKMLGINLDGEVHLMEEGFKRLFPKWETTEYGDGYTRLYANAYGVTFFCLIRKEN